VNGQLENNVENTLERVIVKLKIVSTESPLQTAFLIMKSKLS
jgi:hypothetical protein